MKTHKITAVGSCKILILHFHNYVSLETVYYTGTQEEWNALLENIGSKNEKLTGATINFNYTGE